MPVDIRSLEERSKGKVYRQRRCRVAEALAQYDARGDAASKQAIEESLDNKKITDNAITVELKEDGIDAFAESAGPQSVSFHRSHRCICFDGEPTPAELGLVPEPDADQDGGE